MIFCRTTEEVEFLYSIFVNKREELGFGSDEDFIIQKYYARLQTENSITKADRLNQYLNAERGLMISTSAFGMGIDKEVAGIKYIIHYGLPYSMEDYYQQIGRAARKKNMDGECYVVYIKNKPAHYDQHMCEQTKNIISFLREKIVNIIFDKCPKSELNSDDDGSKEYVNDMLERYFMYFDMSVAIAVNTFRGKMKSNVYEYILKALEKNGISLDVLSVKKGLFCKGLFWEIENDKAINDALGRHKPRKREEGIVLRQIENEKRIRMDDYDRVPVVFGHRSPLASFLEKGYTTGIVEFERKSKVYMDFTMEYREDEKKVFVGDEIPREKRVIAFDLILIDIVYTLRKYRLKTDTDTIIKTMFCSDTVRKDHRRELVNDRINVLSKLYIKYDMYPQKDPVETQVSPEEALLPLSKVKKTERNNNEFWFGESILTKLDSEKNTFYVLTCRDIRAGLYGYQYQTDKPNGERVTFEAVVLTYSILKRIKMFRLGRVSNVIKVFESISDIPVLELLNGVSKNRSDVDKMNTKEIKRAVKNIEKCIYGILDGFVDNKVIAGYTPADRVIRKSTDPDQENYGIKSIYVPLLCVPDQSSIHNRVLHEPVFCTHGFECFFIRIPEVRIQ